MLNYVNDKSRYCTVVYDFIIFNCNNMDYEMTKRFFKCDGVLISAYHINNLEVSGLVSHELVDSKKIWKLWLLCDDQYEPVVFEDIEVNVWHLKFRMKGRRAAVVANIAGGLKKHIYLVAKRKHGINQHYIYEWKLYSKTSENERNTVILMYFQTSVDSIPLKYLGYANL